MKIIVFEGLDCSGKTTLLNAVKDSLIIDHHPMFIDRFIHSSYVYESIKGTLNFYDLYEFYEKCINNFDISVVYIDTPIDVVKKRLEICRHKEISDELLRRQKMLFNTSFTLFPINKLVLENVVSIDESVEMIYKEIL